MKKLTKSNDKVLTGVLGVFGNWILPRSISLYYCSSNNARKNRQR